MASPHSVDSSIIAAVPLADHIKALSSAFDSAIKLAKVIGEARGNGTLKPGKKLKLDEDRMVGVEDLSACVSSIKAELRKIPKMVNDAKKAEKAAKKAASSNNKPKAHCPKQYTSVLIDFLKKADLGTSRDGHTRLQADADMALFFNNGIGSLTFGVSLFNVLGNNYKLKTGKNRVYLDAEGRRALSGALEALKASKREKLSNPEMSEKKRGIHMSDLQRLEEGEIQNKDYMPILSFYNNKDIDPAQLAPFVPNVALMSEITKDMNKRFGATKAHEEPTPVAPVMPKGVSLPPVPVIAPKTTTVPPVPTVARGASPVVPRRR